MITLCFNEKNIQAKYIQQIITFCVSVSMPSSM